jgi:3-deoxy-D-manno-octulosonic-acid transferase
MTFFYYFFALLIYLISLPFLFFLLFKQKYKKSIPARFFLYKNPPFSKKNYHFHACSFGEVRALKPLFEVFKNPNISVITQTGFDEAKKYGEARFLPYEIFLPFWFRECKSLVVMEAELWYMLFLMGKKRCNKTVLLNARISDRSYPKYLKFKWFYKHIFKNIDIVLAQSEKDKKRLIELGAKNVEVVGNIKTVFNPKITKSYKKKKPLIVVASTHPNEEEMILKELDLENYQVVVAPRHPERFKEVEDFLKEFAQKRKKSFERLRDENLRADIILDDKLGELINLYKVADMVILGGSFVDNVGGHNPIEAAFFNVPIISGRHYFNQHALYEEVENIEITDITHLKEALKRAKPTFIKQKVDLKKIVSFIK